MNDRHPYSAAIARIRAQEWTPQDLEWLRATSDDPPLGWATVTRRNLRCDCRCQCHLGAPCGMPVYLDELDCRQACRSAHILASDCNLDENRATLEAVAR